MRLVLCSCVLMLPFLLGVSALRHYAEGAPRSHVISHAPSGEVYQDEIHAPGIIEGSSRDVPLRMQTSGSLAVVYVTEGRQVRKGDELARLDSELWEHELARAEAGLRLAQGEKQRLCNGARAETLEILRADVSIAEARLKHTERSLQRVIFLQKRGAVIEQEVDDRTAAFEAAQAALKSVSAKYAETAASAREDELAIADSKIALAEAHVRHARKCLEQCTLRAPRDGVVARVQAEPGELVGPNSADPLLVLVTPETLHVRAFVEELDAVRVQNGLASAIRVDGIPGVRFRGQIVSCAPSMVSKTMITDAPGESRDVKVREVLILLDRQDDLSKLVIGLPVEVSFSVSTESAT